MNKVLKKINNYSKKPKVNIIKDLYSKRFIIISRLIPTHRIKKNKTYNGESKMTGKECVRNL